MLSSHATSMGLIEVTSRDTHLSAITENTSVGNAYRYILHKYDIESGQAPDGRTVESSNMAVETDLNHHEGRPSIPVDFFDRKDALRALTTV